VEVNRNSKPLLVDSLEALSEFSNQNSAHLQSYSSSISSSHNRGLYPLCYFLKTLTGNCPYYRVLTVLDSPDPGDVLVTGRMNAKLSRNGLKRVYTPGGCCLGD
jgi:hypothetical protein